MAFNFQPPQIGKTAPINKPSETKPVPGKNLAQRPVSPGKPAPPAQTQAKPAPSQDIWRGRQYIPVKEIFKAAQKDYSGDVPNSERNARYRTPSQRLDVVKKSLGGRAFVSKAELWKIKKELKKEEWKLPEWQRYEVRNRARYLDKFLEGDKGKK